MIDTHAHLFSSVFIKDFDSMMVRASSVGVTDVILPAIDRSSWSSMRELKSCDVNIWPTAGLHPTSVKGNIKQELRYLDQFVQKYPIKAIGESGFDFYHSVKFAHQQLESFLWHCDIALAYNLPIICHVSS